MRLLALDTSTEACSVALLLHGELHMRFALTGRSHAELVLPMVDSLLSEASLTLAELDGLAFGRGPGAFTGLRIAAGVAQGLALGANLRVAAVSSLAAVAEQVPAGARETILACNDARMGEVYWGLFERTPDGTLVPRAAEAVSAPERVGEDAPSAVHAAGNALLACPSLGERLAADGVRLHAGVYPRADAVARLGERLLAAGAGVPADQALPVYVRDEVARRPDATAAGKR